MPNAAEADMAHGAVNHLWLALHWSVAPAVAGAAKERATFHNLAGDLPPIVAGFDGTAGRVGGSTTSSFNFRWRGVEYTSFRRKRDTFDNVCDAGQGH